jgi:hypothetical protein
LPQYTSCDIMTDLLRFYQFIEKEFNKTIYVNSYVGRTLCQLYNANFYISIWFYELKVTSIYISYQTREKIVKMTGALEE